jgi:hypothetical protein
MQADKTTPEITPLTDEKVIQDNSLQQEEEDEQEPDDDVDEKALATEDTMGNLQPTLNDPLLAANENLRSKSNTELQSPKARKSSRDFTLYRTSTNTVIRSSANAAELVMSVARQSDRRKSSSNDLLNLNTKQSFGRSTSKPELNIPDGAAQESHYRKGSDRTVKATDEYSPPNEETKLLSDMDEKDEPQSPQTPRKLFAMEAIRQTLDYQLNDISLNSRIVLWIILVRRLHLILQLI